MGVAERKEREKLQMKVLIKNAALKLFLRDGIAGTSIRSIAGEIKYSPATIYLYYRDKDELLYEVQADAYLRLLEAFRQHADSTLPLERLRQICVTYISFGLANPELYDLMFIMRSPMNVDEKIHRTNGGDSLAYLADCLSDCILENLLTIDDLQTAVLQVWSTAHGLVSLDLRRRLNHMSITHEEIPGMLLSSIENYVRSITR
ncbi:TetR/AcrR family transcriptional regulator [Mucilaginibacter celer]|nr:TetR/AcrR family transcriptional regulator [Mucilaginibacter celer]